MNPLVTLTDQVSNLTQMVQELGGKMSSFELGHSSSTLQASSPHFEPQIKLPEPFSGDRRKFLSFNLPGGMIMLGILFQKRYHFFAWKFGVMYCRPAILSNYLLKPDQNKTLVDIPDVINLKHKI